MDTIEIGGYVLWIPENAFLNLFWVLVMVFSFNGAYFFFRFDRKQNQFNNVSKGKVYATALIGTLIILGTYGNLVMQKPFAIADCSVLALVAAHGWMAEDMVRKFISQIQQPEP
ncbi:hypothetical protein [Fulvivirga sp.]|uniref:hypothetical protein n=1 Tax=Fulvivirga sp. TaxID=1931237 RepID=UPI0032EDCDAC